MNRSVPTLELRGSDQALLEVQLPDLLRRPIGQIAPVNWMDLVQLSVTDGRPKSTDKALQGFVAGLPRQLADIPRGRSWEMFLDDLEELPGERVPTLFREMVGAESKERPDTARRVDELLERWRGAEPAPFGMNARHAHIQRATMVEPKPERPRPDLTADEDLARAPKVPKAKPTPKPKVITDVDRHDFLVQQCLERLSRTTSDRGLLEAVLLAGVKHAGKERYPDLTPIEITQVLRQLKDRNRVRYSAGRWMAR